MCMYPQNTVRSRRHYYSIAKGQYNGLDVEQSLKVEERSMEMGELRKDIAEWLMGGNVKKPCCWHTAPLVE